MQLAIENVLSVIVPLVVGCIMFVLNLLNFILAIQYHDLLNRHKSKQIHRTYRRMVIMTIFTIVCGFAVTVSFRLSPAILATGIFNKALDEKEIAFFLALWFISVTYHVIYHAFNRKSIKFTAMLIGIHCIYTIIWGIIAYQTIVTVWTLLQKAIDETNILHKKKIDP